MSFLGIELSGRLKRPGIGGLVWVVMIEGRDGVRLVLPEGHCQIVLLNLVGTNMKAITVLLRFPFETLQSVYELRKKCTSIV